MQTATKSTLCALVEEQITSLVRDAAAVQRHTKRARLYQSGDSGENNNEVKLRRTLLADDINLALQFRGQEKMLVTNAGNMMKTQEKVDLNALISSEMRHQPPSEIGMTLHWLAVNGVQPNISQNPIDIRRGGADQVGLHHGAEEEDGDIAAHMEVNKGNMSSSAVSVRQLFPRVLGEELRLYFTRVTHAIERGGPLQQDAALISVSRDSGTQELVPFFVTFIVDQMLNNIGQTQYCLILVRLVHALITNPHLHPELHLHQLMSPILTCVVAKKLASEPFDNHWALRDQAAQTLVRLCHIFGDQYPNLKPRILVQMREAIERNRPLGTQYGGIVAISLFGPKAIDSLILPLVAEYWTKWQKALYVETNREKRYELQRCMDALLGTMTIFLGQVKTVEQSEEIDHEELSDVFGDQLVPVMSNRHDCEYFSCFL